MTSNDEARSLHAFEEFQLFYESAEKVTDRRLSANRWNYSICTAIMVAIVGILNWGLSQTTFLLVATIAVLLLSAMAVLFCSLWIGQIADFKKLNNAKFEVLNKMAPSVSFAAHDKDARKSYSPFEKEWLALQKAEAVQELTRFNLVALKSSNIEYLIPRAFRILFVAVMLCVVLGVARNWDAIAGNSVLEISASSSPTQ